jgi:TRAP-type mannitol/chloroaromatic compound transport system permease small subunit
LRNLIRITSFVDALTDRISGLISFIVVLTVIAGFLNAALRYLGQLLQQTLISNQLIQSQWYLFSLLFLIGFPYLLKHNVNVRVDFFYSRWGPRQRALVDFLGTLLFLLRFTSASTRCSSRGDACPTVAGGHGRYRVTLVGYRSRRLRL